MRFVKQLQTKKELVIVVVAAVFFLAACAIVITYRVKRASDQGPRGLVVDKIEITEEAKREALRHLSIGGKIVASTPNSITIKTDSGEDKTFTLTDKSIIARGVVIERITIADIPASQKVTLGYDAETNEVMSIWY